MRNNRIVLACFVVMLACQVIGLLVFLGGCSAVGAQTYPVTAEQIAAMREMLHVQPCPVGKANFAGLVEYPMGGGVVSIKCDATGMMK